MPRSTQAAGDGALEAYLNLINMQEERKLATGIGELTSKVRG